MKVSIVTPSFNQGKFIERTLQSVACQSSPTFELEHVIFDGGSTDSTVSILQNFVPPVRWVSKKDKGQADAINQGILATDGDILSWLNSDDIYYPGAVAKVVEFFREHPEVDVVYGMADHIDIEDHAFEPYPTESWDMERLKETCYICQPALFFRRRVIDNYGLLDDALNYCMDYEFWLRLGKAGVRFAFLQEKLAGSRLYPDNKTLGSRIKVHREINEMLKRVLGKVPLKWLLGYAQVVVESKINKQSSPRCFLSGLAIIYIYAALRWEPKSTLVVMKLAAKKLFW